MLFPLRTLFLKCNKLLTLIYFKDKFYSSNKVCFKVYSSNNLAPKQKSFREFKILVMALKLQTETVMVLLSVAM